MGWRRRWRTAAIAEAVDLLDAGKPDEARAVLVEARDGIEDPPSEPMPERVCGWRECGMPYWPRSGNQRYCTPRCRAHAAAERLEGP